MLSIRSVDAKRALLVVLGLAVLASSFQARAQSPDPGITDGILAISVQGDEYRSTSGYPEDQVGRGYDDNAYNHWQSSCQNLEVEMRAVLGDAISGFDCGAPKNISKKSDRIQYVSEALAYTNTRIYWEYPVDEIAGDFISAEDYSDEYKWQTSRTAAREAYNQACLAFKEDALQEYGQHLLFADCGVTTESNSKYGWQYKSQPTLLLFVPPPVTPKPTGCANGRKEGEQWWSVSRKNPIREYGTCTWGGSKTNLYERQTLKICRDGDIEARQERRGAFLGSNGYCNPEPTNCGSYSNGSSWYEVRGYMDGYMQCRHDNRSVPALYQRLVRYYCDRGYVRSMGETTGDLVRVIGRCERPHRPKPDHPRPRPCPRHDQDDRDQDRRGGDNRHCPRPDPKPPKPQDPKPQPPKPQPPKPQPPKPDHPRPWPPHRPDEPKPRPGPQDPRPGPIRPRPQEPTKPKPQDPKPQPQPPKPQDPKPQPPKPDHPRPWPPHRPDEPKPRPGPQEPRPGPGPIRPRPPKDEPTKPKPQPPKPDRPKPNLPRPSEPRPQPPKPEKPRPGPGIPRPDRPKPQPPKPSEPKPGKPKPNFPGKRN